MKHLKQCTIALLLTITTGWLFGQTEVAKIDLPETNELASLNGGTLIMDIISANDWIFTYSPDGISVYSANNNTFETKIAFVTPVEGGAPVEYAWGKFNPVYPNAEFSFADHNLMVYNTNNQYLYVLTPQMHFLVINTINMTNWTVSLPVDDNGDPTTLDNILDTQSETIIMKYDDRQGKERLYIHVASRYPTTDPGEVGDFHEQRSLFGIYEINTNVTPDAANHFTLLYNEVRDPGNYDGPGVHINNFTFNEKEDSDYYYTVRLGNWESGNKISEAIIEVNEVGHTENPRRTITFLNEHGDNEDAKSYYKMGKMLYINDETNSVHKIVVLPSTYFVGNVPMPRFLVIDGDNSLNANLDQMIYSPSRKVLDAVYLEENQDLVIAYAPDNDEIYNADPNTNIAVFHYDATDGFGTIPSHQYDTDGSTITSDYDLNASLFLTKTDASTVLISKKDGIVMLTYESESYTYGEPPIYTAEGNAFGRGVIYKNEPDEIDKSFILNSVSNGFEVIDNGDYTLLESIKTGYPVYHITANTDGNLLFCYNQLNAYNTGLYTYNTNSEDITHIDIDVGIGDVVYNPYQDQFLISKFEPGDNSEILTYTMDDNENIVQGTPITLTGVEFAKEMFISPNGKLYVCTNMSTDQSPTIYVLDANDYANVIGSFTLGEFPEYLYYDPDEGETIPLPTVYYNAYIAYNNYDESVNITVSMQDPKLSPYNSQASSIFNIVDDTYPPIPPPPGKLVIDKNDQINEINLTHYPGKIIIPDMGNENSQYYGKMYIIGEGFYEYDYLSDPSPSQESELLIVPDEGDSYFFINMAYSPYHDKLFVIQEGIGGGTEIRTYTVLTIYYDENGIVIEDYELPELIGQIASFFYNPFDKLIYVYQKIDGPKLGETEVKLLSFDPGAEDPTWNDAIDLGFSSYFPEYDHTRDKAHFYYYNMITPYISPFNNKIYLPNGGHSSISTVGYTPNETLYFEAEEWSWFSCPRTTEHPFQESASVVENNILPETFSWAEISSLPFGGDEASDIITMDYSIELGWTYATGELTDIFNVRGYKLQFEEEDYEERHLYLHGTVTEPSTSIELYGDQKENWTGYWLHQTQDVFDALGSQESKFYLIKHEDWTCVRGTAPWKSGGTGPPDPNAWTCDKSVRNLRYGDMVVLKSNIRNEQENKFWFSWALNGYLPSDENATQNPSYYTYTEQSDYTPIVVELDSADQPLEIGAFINDTCVGVSVVDNGDSTIAIRTYLDGNTEDSVTFEKYYGTKSVNHQHVRDYYVWDRDHLYKEKRAIRLGENRDHYFVSFRRSKENEIEPASSTFDCWPNPASTTLYCHFELGSNKRVDIQILDISGRVAASLLQETMAVGHHRMKFELTTNSGNKLKPGIYFIRYKAGEIIETNKLIVR